MRQVVRQGGPLAAGPGHIQDGVHDLAQVHLARPSDLPRLRAGRQQRADQRPLGIRQVIRVRSSLAHTAQPTAVDHNFNRALTASNRAAERDRIKDEADHRAWSHLYEVNDEQLQILRQLRTWLEEQRRSP